MTRADADVEAQVVSDVLDARECATPVDKQQMFFERCLETTVHDAVGVGDAECRPTGRGIGPCRFQTPHVDPVSYGQEAEVSANAGWVSMRGQV